MNIVFTEWNRALIYLTILVLVLVFSMLIHKTLFNELDYYEVKYTRKTKMRTLWLIYSGLISITLWSHVLQLLLDRL